MIVVTIERLAAGGRGVGRLPDGKAVFVSRTAPGDVAEIDIVSEKRRWSEGRLVGLRHEGPARTRPRCQHYVGDDCGGCQLQHVAYAAQTDAKLQMVGDALRRIGKIDVPDPSIVSSPRPWRYRRKITLSGRTEDGTPGLHRLSEIGGAFVPVDCPITVERVMKLWNRVREHRESLPASGRSIVIQESRDRLLSVTVTSPEPWDAMRLACAVGDPQVSYWSVCPGRAPQLAAGPEPGFPVAVFEQSNPELAAEIRRAAVTGLGAVTGRIVWDLYGGVGDTARLLAQAGARVSSVDSNPAASQWGQKEHQSSETTPGSIRFVAGRVEAAIRRLPTPHAVVVNPPRTGLAAAVSAWLNRWGEQTAAAPMAYVSCNPATLARDLARLPHLRLRQLTAYDLFPQTAHVETLALLRGSA